MLPKILKPKETPADIRRKEREAEIRFQLKMESIKDGFDKGINHLKRNKAKFEKMRDTAKATKNMAEHKAAVQQLNDTDKFLNKLINNRGRVQVYISKLETIKLVTGSLSGLTGLTNELGNIIDGVDLTGLTSEEGLGMAVLNFSAIEKELDRAFEKIDKIFDIKEDEDAYLEEDAVDEEAYWASVEEKEEASANSFTSKGDDSNDDDDDEILASIKKLKE